MLNQIGGGGFAISAGDPNQGQPATGLGPEGSRQLSGPAGQRFRRYQHSIAWPRRLKGRRGLANHRSYRTGLQGLGPEAAPIHLGARQPHKQSAPPDAARVTADAAQLPVGHAHRHLQTHLLQDWVEQLGHGVVSKTGAYLSVLAGKTVLLQPNLQAGASQPGRHPGQLPISLAGAHLQHRHLQPKAGLQGGITIHIDQLQRQRRIDGAQLLLQSLTQTAPLAG